MCDDYEYEVIKPQYIDPVAPTLGTKLYVWGAISTYTMTKAEYDELFGQAYLTNKSGVDE